MPTQIPFDWREDETSLIFVLSTPGVKAKNLSVAICDVYVKVNLPPALFEVDLLHEIDPEHPKTRCRVSPNKVTVTLQKRVPQIWDEFRAAGAKADLRVRRQAALDALEQREAERLQKRKDFKEEMLKQGEHAQWRLDSQNRETIEKWEQEEKEKWEEEVYRSFDSATGDLLESERRDDELDADVVSSEVQPPLDQEVEEASEPQVVKPEEPIWTEEDLADTEEYVPDVRDNPGKIGLRFTERPRPGVPVRDRGRKPAPFPKEAPKTELPPMLAGDEREEDENDPVWLKDKGDQLMVRGDYTGAYNAYTEALKLASNARCFANRALTSLYLGNFEQCLEDCNRSIQILDFRNKPRNGELHHSADPEDEKVRARVEIRMGVAFLWLGAFKKAEAHFEKALGTEGLDAEEIKQVRQDLERVQSAYRALKVKDQADQSLRQGDEEAVEKALELYGQADHTTKQECAVVMANRCLAHLQTSQLQQCLEDASMALMALKRWPVARAVKAPKRPTRLDPPYLDDPTFVHPDKQNQGEREWLMKHNGGNAKELPGLPDEYEWIKDVAEKNENAWIAVKKRMSKVTFDAIKRATAELQDALYTRQPEVIRQQMEVAKDQNKVGEGPSSKAILQAEDYAKKLEDYAKEQEAQREHEEEPSDIEAAPTSVKEGTNAWQRRISDPATVKLTLAEACAKADEAAAKAMDKERPVMGLMMRREAKGSLLLDVEGDAEAKTVWPDSILNLFRQAGQPSKASTDMAVGAGMKSLMLYCGAAERPDPLKASTGGEDSLFICPNGSAAGVADGVGSMKGFGIDPKPFADKLMAAAKASALRPESEKVQMNIQCKAKVCLREAYEATQTPEIIYGASTALVCVLDPSEAKLGVANLGDSGLRILRWSDGFSKTHIAERTSEQQHGFNCPFSLSRLPKENRRDRVGKDMPEKAFAYTFEVQEGDVVLLGTDGIFDNLHDREVCDLATIAMQGGRQINPQRLAEAFVEAARVRIEDSNYKALTPFGIHAKNYGIKWQGGKMDDITVVACVVTPK